MPAKNVEDSFPIPRQEKLSAEIMKAIEGDQAAEVAQV